MGADLSPRVVLILGVAHLVVGPWAQRFRVRRAGTVAPSRVVNARIWHGRERPGMDGEVDPLNPCGACSSRVYADDAGRELHPRMHRKATEGIVVDRIDQRVWYVVAAVVVLLLLAWLLGWFGGAEVPAPTTTP